MSNGYLTEVGKKYILSSFFKGESIQDKLYIGLCGNISLEGQIEGEPVGHTGYMRVVLNGESWKMADGPSITTDPILFRNRGNGSWPEITTAFLSFGNALNSPVIAVSFLDHKRILFKGDALEVPIKIRFS